MNIIFFGTPEIAIPSLEEINKYHNIKAVVTQIDKPAGRSKTLQPSPIAKKAIELNLPLYKPEKLDDSFIEEMRRLNCDIFVTFAYGKIFKENIFSITRLGGINIHPSLLPDLRGPSPIQTAILKGYTESGITIQKIALQVDSGDIILQEKFQIKDEDDQNSIEKLVSEMSKEMIRKALEKIEKDGKIIALPQDHNRATYCRIINKEDGKINWQTSTKKEIFNKIRAFVNWPTAYCFIDGKKLDIYKAEIVEENSQKIVKNMKEVSDNNLNETQIISGKIVEANKNSGIIVKCNDGFLKIIELKLEGKNKLNYKDFINGYRNLEGKILE